MKKNVSLPVLIYGWIRERLRNVENALFRYLLYKHEIQQEGQQVHTYWMNIVRCVGGMEKMKPCEFIFENPWNARMHEQICKTCMTWQFVATVKITSPVELTTTDYQKMVDEDEDYQKIVREMQQSSTILDD